MPVVLFYPSEISVEVPVGTGLLDAARKAGIDIDSPCGGKGTCGKCIVQVLSGEVDFKNPGILSDSAVERGHVLACRTFILDGHVTIDVPEQSDKENGQFIDETDDTCLTREQLFPGNFPFNPLIERLWLEVPLPQLEDGLSDLDRLKRAITEKVGPFPIDVPLPIIRQISESLRSEDQIGKVTLLAIKEHDRYRVIQIQPGHHEDTIYGLAVDIGTTTVAVQLVELPSARVIATQTAYNQQILCGLDVISRINYARKQDHLTELHNRVIDTVNNLIYLLCKGNRIEIQEIYGMVVSGNTTMIHLLLALPPEYIRLEPYTPTILTSPYFNAEQIGININPHSAVYIAPSVGSYVGGDITSGLLCTEIAEETDNINLFIDIGTNGELVIGSNDFLMTCACSAGPAFEGGGIHQGMRATLGAIEKVEIDAETGIASYQTIGAMKPKGICGSGMISLLSGLFHSGWLDAAGKLNRSKSSPAIQVHGRQALYIIAPAEETETGEPVFISEIDFDNIIRAKAAIYAACALMLEQVGLSFEDLSHIFIAGGFGRFLDIEKAIHIGLLPDLPREKFYYIGNSSLMGAYMVLVSQEHHQKQIEIAKRMTYIELSTDPAYMDQFTGASFLPHTDSKRFPSVVQKKPL